MTAARGIVVGLGYAGRRFAQALRYLEQTEGTVRLVAGVDRSPAAALDGLPHYTEVAPALAHHRPDVVCVTVNERSHASVFAALADHPGLLVVTEKPLTVTTAEAVQAARDLHGHRVSMNLVERFSPVVDRYLQWAAGQVDLRVVRAEAFWGKHRLFDPRPTMGVLSELIHPLDLVDLLFVRLAGHPPVATTVVSDFSLAGEAPESVVATFDAGGVPVTLHASFTWPTRRREVSALVRTADGLHRVVLHFDEPHWDCDQLLIDRVDETTGRWERCVEWRTDVADQPTEIAGIAKVVECVRRSMVDGSPTRPALRAPVADLPAAVRLQSLLEAVGTATRTPAAVGRYRERRDLGEPSGD